MRSSPEFRHTLPQLLSSYGKCNLGVLGNAHYPVVKLDPQLVVKQPTLLKKSN